MKKTFDSLAPCLELREVIFLRSLPGHAHLVPALDILLDPITKKLHIAMEYMDGNLYQLMKARDRKCLDGPSVTAGAAALKARRYPPICCANRFPPRPLRGSSLLSSALTAAAPTVVESRSR